MIVNHPPCIDDIAWPLSVLFACNINALLGDQGPGSGWCRNNLCTSNKSMSTVTIGLFTLGTTRSEWGVRSVLRPSFLSSRRLMLLIPWPLVSAHCPSPAPLVAPPCVDNKRQEWQEGASQSKQQWVRDGLYTDKKPLKFICGKVAPIFPALLGAKNFDWKVTVIIIWSSFC